MREVKYFPIGIIHSSYKKPINVPIQAVVSQCSEGTVELYQKYVDGLQDLEGFSHIILIYHFHLSKKYSLIVKPFLDDKNHGVFSTRAPSRPNPIGISIVRLEGIEDNILLVRDIDVVDGTPLLDIKPYVSDFDQRKQVRNGWLEYKSKKADDVLDNGRFSTH